MNGLLSTRRLSIYFPEATTDILRSHPSHQIGATGSFTKKDNLQIVAWESGLIVH